MEFESTMPCGSLSLQSLLSHAAQVHGDREIVTLCPDGSRQIQTYKTLQARAQSLAAALRNTGLRKGDSVATLMWNHAAHLEAHFGVTLAGGVLVPLNIRLHANDITKLIGRSGSRYLFVDDILMPRFRSIAFEGQDTRTWTYSLGGGNNSADSYEYLLESAPEGREFLEPLETDPAVVCYSSGTTGQPKCIVYSHRSLVLHSLATALPDVFALSRNDVVLTVAPLFHISGWTLPFGATLVGARQVLPGSQTDPKDLLDILAREGVTFTAAVPTVWYGVLSALDAEPQRWHLSGNLRIMTGGAAPSEALIAGLRSHGITVLHTWGMTETTAAATVSKTAFAVSESGGGIANQIAKQGTPIPLVQLRIRREGRVPPCDGKTGGELQVKGPWITERYHGTAEGQNAFTEDGWLRTGDIAAREPNGVIRLLDREEDLIKSGGEWISSLALENAIMGHSAVALAAVVSYPHPKWQERPVAFIVTKEHATVCQEELRNLLKRDFADWWIPDGFEFVDDLPRSPGGKLDRSALRILAHRLTTEGPRDA